MLAATPPDEYARLIAQMRPVYLTSGEELAFPEEQFERVYFPRGAVVSMLVPMEDGKTVESAIIGNEGMIGLETFLGDGISRDIAIVQIDGQAGWIPTATFKDIVGSVPHLQELLQHYALALMNQIVRTAGCNRMHSVDERCARWLLMGRDRAGRSDFLLTHRFFAKMLGVRRASVSEAAERLQRAGLIRYRQGRVQILDGPGLEAVACEDYRLTQAAYDHLYA